MNDGTDARLFVEGSGNIFADMGLDDADELLLRSQLGYSVRKILRRRTGI